MADKRVIKYRIYIFLIIILLFLLYLVTHGALPRRATAIKHAHEAKAHVSVPLTNKHAVDYFLVEVKSILMFSSTITHFHVYYTDELVPKLIEQNKSKYLSCLVNIFYYTSYKMNTSVVESAIGHKYMSDFNKIRLYFKPVSYFMWQESLAEYEHVLALDADVLLFDDISKVIQIKSNFNSTQLVAFGYSSLRYFSGIKDSFPWPRPLGENGGIFLVDLERWRKDDTWTKFAASFKDYSGIIGKHASEQNWLNIHFGLNPHQLYQLPCGYNFNTGIDRCSGITDGFPPDFEAIRKEICADVYKEGIVLLHGTANSFNKKHVGNTSSPLFGNAFLFDAVKNFRVDSYNAFGYWVNVYSEYVSQRQSMNKIRQDCDFPGNPRDLLKNLIANVVYNYPRWRELCSILSR